jgi:hypothetical protein
MRASRYGRRERQEPSRRRPELINVDDRTHTEYLKTRLVRAAASEICNLHAFDNQICVQDTSRVAGSVPHALSRPRAYTKDTSLPPFVTTGPTRDIDHSRTHHLIIVEQALPVHPKVGQGSGERG